MKCPKCGYNSFESNDICRKCTNDLTGFKQAHGIIPVVLPAELRQQMAASMGGGIAVETPQTEAGGNDMFSFDLPQHEEPQTSQTTSDPFTFDTPAPAAASTFSFDTPAAAPTNDPFAELLESTPTAPKAAPTAPASAAEPAQGFELNSFSWDETPEPAAAGSAPQTVAKSSDDDFNSLFGDLGSPEQKP